MSELGIPEYEALLGDLTRLRASGLGRLRELKLSALGAAAGLVARGGGPTGSPSEITILLRTAVETLGGGSLQEAAEYSLGLYPGTALWSGALRRESAADAFGLRADTFRKSHEKSLLGQIAEAVLVSCHDAELRQARVEIEERRHPGDSRLAVQWVERFEAYNRIWTPVYALAADLEAAIDTYLEEPSEHPPWAPDSNEPYDRDSQARGYGRSALYRLAEFWLEVKRFKSRHGGMWLLSDPQAEETVSDAVYRIGWHNSLSDRDESFLRRHLADARHEEAAQFWDILQAFQQGVDIDRRWQQMILDAVDCHTEEEKAGSQTWLTIAACHEYCDLIDQEWLKIADWYRPGSVPEKKVSGSSLYDDLLKNRQIRSEG